MLELSRYLVPVNCHDAQLGQDITLVYSTRSNSLRRFSKDVWADLCDRNFDKLQPSVLDGLMEDKILISQDENEIDRILDENKKYINQSKNLYFAIQPTAACPLGCGYCGQNHSAKNMSADVQNDLINRIEQKLTQKRYTTLSLTWFGAEPLSGWPVIKKLSPRILELVKQHQLNYFGKIVTNGVLLNETVIKELINQYRVKNFEITLDGTQEFHDQRRHTKEGGKSFDTIYQNLHTLAQYDEATIIIRSNVDARNRAGVTPLLEKLASDNLQKRLCFYVAPIHSWGNDAHLVAAEKKDFARWEIDWLLDMQRLGFQTSFLPKRSHSVCFTVNPEHELIDPFGEVFSCSEVSLVPTYEKNGKNVHSLGSLKEADLSHPHSPWGNFYSQEALKKYDCMSCSMLPTCGGACPKEWGEGRVPCPPPKFNIAERILLSYANSKQMSPSSDPLTA